MSVSRCTDVQVQGTDGAGNLTVTLLFLIPERRYSSLRNALFRLDPFTVSIVTDDVNSAASCLFLKQNQWCRFIRTDKTQNRFETFLNFSSRNEETCCENNVLGPWRRMANG